MIDREDILKISNLVNKIKNEITKKENINIETINLENFELIDNDFVFIDSSYVSGIIGPISYIYIRAAAISKKSEIKIKDHIIFPDIFIDIYEENKLKSLELSQLADIFSKNLEYKLVYETKEKYKVIDGSLISDFILFQKIQGSPIEEIDRRIKSFKEHFFISDKIKQISIAKRILHSKLFNFYKSDFILLLNTFPFNEFCTKIIKKEINERRIKAVYIRARKHERIYRVECWDNIDDNEFYSIIKTLFYNKSYPLLLKMSHNICKIRKKEKEIIEELIKKELGIEKSIGWETK